MQKGTQVAYVPVEAIDTKVDQNGIIDWDHPSVEYGFVMNVIDDAVRVRYWSKRNPGALRTLSCSEITEIEYLVEKNSVDQSIIDEWIDKIEHAPDKYGK